MIYTVEYLMDKIKSSETAYDIKKITDAYILARDSHGNQMRESGEPYISHPIAVACILLDYRMDTDTIVAALLHDVVEDTDVTLETLAKKFGNDVARLVDGVTKIKHVPLVNTKEEQKAETTRKILIAMSKDIRVIIIKLADRLHNMRTLEFKKDPQKRLQTAVETLNFYAPIANRLGINDIKEEMEDIALRYLDPYGYKNIEQQLKNNKQIRETFIEKIKEKIAYRVSDFNPKPIIEGRVKSMYSIYKKVYVKGKNFNEIYDIYAVRVIVQTVSECYDVLGIIHDMFRPIPYRFKDYISTPKANRYQSLHTTVIGREGIPFEVQIRTQEMHNTAQYGIAAHWKYKAGLNGKVEGEKRFEWIRKIIEQQQEADDVEQITEAIKVDLAPDEVYVFTPKGDVITLPLGSTVIDFAFAIHTQVGLKMSGAKVGGRMVSFDYKLTTGEIVEIMTTNSPSYGPSKNWLDIVMTNGAKSKIRAWFKSERRDENIAEGKAAVEREFKRNNIEMDEEFLLSTAQRQHFDTINDFYAAIGYGGVMLSKIMGRIKDDYVKMKASPLSETVNPSYTLMNNIARRQSQGVIVEGIDNCLVRFANCCNPIPGDEIIGFITRGFGVSIHKRDCPNVISSQKNDDENNKNRWVNVMWTAEENSYRATIDVTAENRNALVADITAMLAAAHITLTDINAHSLKNGNASVVITMETAGLEQLQNTMLKLKKIPGVISVERSGKF